jgi:hypothetical protein
MGGQDRLTGLGQRPDPPRRVLEQAERLARRNILVVEQVTPAGDHHQARAIVGDRRGQAFHDQGLQLVAREGAGEMQALHDRLGELPGFPGQARENIGVKGIGPIHVQDRPPAQGHLAGQGRPQIQDEGRSDEQGQTRPGCQSVFRGAAGGPRRGQALLVPLGKVTQECQEAIVLLAGDGTHPDHGS